MTPDPPRPPPRLRSVSRDHPEFDVLGLVDRLVAGGRADLSAASGQADVVTGFSDALVAVASSAAALHGHRTQRLFRTVMMDLEEVAMVKEEDAGDLLTSGPNLQAPDYRVVLADGSTVLVEVKNHFPKNNPSRPYSMRASDHERLREYAMLVGSENLQLAVYWAPWNLWTLTDLNGMVLNGKRYELDLGSAIKANQLASMGDFQIGVEWPLTLRLVAARPEPVDPATGEAQFTVGEVQVSVAGRLITDEPEQAIAFQLMLFGSWDSELEPELDEAGHLVAMVFTAAPDEESQASTAPFSFIGWASSIISNRVNALTLDEDGSVKALDSPSAENGFKALIPDDYAGEVLKIWRFKLQPS